MQALVGRVRIRPLYLIGALVIAVISVVMLGRSSAAHAAASFAPQCSDPYSIARTSGNPLMTSPAPPAANPLQGADLFVDGPTHGAAAGQIARLIGLAPNAPQNQPITSIPETDSWASLSNYVARHLSSVSASAQHQITELEKIASEPETERLSSNAAGGTPAGIFSQTQKYLCHFELADPHSVPVFTTYFLHPELGGCATAGQINADRPKFDAQIDAMAQAIGNRPAVLLLEIDAIGSSKCIEQRGGIGAWESALKYEAKTLSLAHTLVYIEGGYSDGNPVGYTAKVLNGAGVRQVAGFWTNDTHLNWTSKELAYDQKVSKQTGGANFIINTAGNGKGPLLTKHKSSEGVEDLCNPPGRGLGPKPTTDTGFPHAAAFLWTYPPGNSSGSCNGGTPSGTWWAAKAVQLAENANQKLGPGYPNRPY
jgi:hypothetical protein